MEEEKQEPMCDIDHSDTLWSSIVGKLVNNGQLQNDEIEFISYNSTKNQEISVRYYNGSTYIDKCTMYRIHINKINVKYFSAYNVRHDKHIPKTLRIILDNTNTVLTADIHVRQVHKNHCASKPDIKNRDSVIDLSFNEEAFEIYKQNGYVANGGCDAVRELVTPIDNNTRNLCIGLILIYQVMRSYIVFIIDGIELIYDVTEKTLRNTQSMMSVYRLNKNTTITEEYICNCAYDRIGTNIRNILCEIITDGKTNPLYNPLLKRR